MLELAKPVDGLGIQAEVAEVAPLEAPQQQVEARRHRGEGIRTVRQAEASEVGTGSDSLALA